eukprot:TRINITY_DN66704_c0_g1_i1.p1 TRINITY_DN66704_c0_g1~~TRINITY_DN66704_c0_g1_i1.p1  ORF type:complete len:167 (+),score=18.70 TRINITY_DN66704_c0_g1_i1:49-549(+)
MSRQPSRQATPSLSRSVSAPGTPLTPGTAQAGASTSSSSTSLPQIQEIGPAWATRQLQNLRNGSGGFYSDARPWPVDSSSAPVLPSRHECLGRSMWSNTVGDCYLAYGMQSEAQASLVDHKLKKFGPVKSFANKMDKFQQHREETFKFGNKQLMRTNKSMGPPPSK